MEGSKVAAYFDLDGTLLDASSEKTLTGHLTKKRPWRIPVGLFSWSSRFAVGLLTGKAVYDAARNRGHFTGVKWSVLEEMSEELVRGHHLETGSERSGQKCLESGLPRHH